MRRAEAAAGEDGVARWGAVREKKKKEERNWSLLVLLARCLGVWLGFPGEMGFNGAEHTPETLV